MAVDRRDHGLGIEEHHVEELAQHRKEVPQVGAAAVERANEIDACGEDPGLSGQHHGRRRGRAELLEPARDVPAELDVQRVDLAVAHLEHGDIAAMTYLEHARGLADPISAHGVTLTVPMEAPPFVRPRPRAPR